jgi:hypothetical protein
MFGRNELFGPLAFLADWQEIEEIRHLEDQLCANTQSREIGFLVKGVTGQRSVAPLSAAKTFFADVPETEVSWRLVLNAIVQLTPSAKSSFTILLLYLRIPDGLYATFSTTCIINMVSQVSM